MVRREARLHHLPGTGVMNAGYGARRDPLTRTQAEAAPGRQFEKEARRSQGAVREAGGAAGAGKLTIDQRRNLPLLEPAVPPIRDGRSDHQAVIVAEVRDDRDRADLVDGAQGRARHLDPDMDGIDQLGGLVQCEAGLARGRRLADPQEIFRLAGREAAGEDRHVGSMAVAGRLACEDRARQPVDSETVRLGVKYPAYLPADDGRAKPPDRLVLDGISLLQRLGQGAGITGKANTLGADATPMDLGEVYQALAQGVVDGAENNWPSYQSGRHYEVAPFYSLTNHVIAPEVLLMAKASWDDLTPGDREIVLASARDSVPYMRQLWDARVAAAREALLADGARVNEVDSGPFRDRMIPVWDSFVVTPEQRALMKSILAMGGRNA